MSESEDENEHENMVEALGQEQADGWAAGLKSSER